MAASRNGWRRGVARLAGWVACCGIIAVTNAGTLAADVTLTGMVSDDTCKARPHAAGPVANCVRACVSESTEYALVVESRVYTLIGEDDVKEALYQLAGQKVVVTGTSQPGGVIAVVSVTPAP